MRVGLALLVLILNTAAITSILGARRGAGRKLAWTAAVLLLPLAGALAWFAAGKRR